MQPCEGATSLADSELRVSATGTVELRVVNTAPRADTVVERSSGPRPGAPWGYVVKRSDGTALEVLVQSQPHSRSRLSSRHEELVLEAGLIRMGPGLELRDALYHQRVVGEQVSEAEAVDRGLNRGCELVGGLCQSEGVFMGVQPIFTEHARTEGEGWHQPEAFWQALEGYLVQLAYPSHFPVSPQPMFAPAKLILDIDSAIELSDGETRQWLVGRKALGDPGPVYVNQGECSTDRADAEDAADGKAES